MPLSCGDEVVFAKIFKAAIWLNIWLKAAQSLLEILLLRHTCPRGKNHVECLIPALFTVCQSSPAVVVSP